MDGVESEARTRPVASSLPCRINETVLPHPPVDGMYACLDCADELIFEVSDMDDMPARTDKHKDKQRGQQLPRTENNLIALVALLHVHLRSEQDARILLAGGGETNVKVVWILGHPVLRSECVFSHETCKYY